MSSYIDTSAVVASSDLAEHTRIYRNVICKGSKIGHASTVGDESIVLHCTLAPNVEINRRNHIEHSTIGSFSYTGENTTIKYANIGKYCSVSWNVSIGGADHEISRPSTHPRFSLTKNAKGTPALPSQLNTKCVIGNDVWIAAGAIILRDVSIGNGAIIAAGAVVTKDVPPYAIVAGVPAKVIRYRFTNEQIEVLNQIQWWNWSEETINQNLHIFQRPVDDDSIGQLQSIAAIGGKQ